MLIMRGNFVDLCGDVLRGWCAVALCGDVLSGCNRAGPTLCACKSIHGPFSRKTRLIIESSSVDHPITCLVPHNGKLSKVILGENEKVAVRVIKHPPARALCAHFGGLLVSTSANPNGQPAARTESKVKEYFLNAIDFVSPGSVGGADNVSEIIDVASGNVVRAR